MKASAPRRPRINRRLRKLLLISLPVWLVAALFCVKLVSMTVENRAGMAAYDSGDHGTARTHFSRLGTGNVAEPWIAHYNRGTANHRLRLYPAARSDFEKALEVAPGAQQCKVRINLALTLEALGDDETAAQNPDRAADLYRQADKVLADARCADPTPGGQQSPSSRPSASSKSSTEPRGKPSQDPSGQPSKGSSGEPSGDPNGEPSSDPNGEPTDAPGGQGGQQGEQQDSPEQQQQRKEETQQRVEDKAEEADRNAERNEGREPPEASEQDQSDPNQSPESKQEQQNQQNQKSQQENAESRDRQKGQSDKTEGKVEDPGGKKRPW